MNLNQRQSNLILAATFFLALGLGSARHGVIPADAAYFLGFLCLFLLVWTIPTDDFPH